jgi:hypothetical protein
MDDIKATDHAIELAKTLGVDLTEVEGTGDDGKILKEDVQKHFDDLAAALKEEEAAADAAKQGDVAPKEKSKPAFKAAVKAAGTRTFQRPNKDGGLDDYEKGIVFPEGTNIEKRCRVVYDRVGAPVIEALKTTIGGAVTYDFVARLERKFAKQPDEEE